MASRSKERRLVRRWSRRGGDPIRRKTYNSYRHKIEPGPSRVGFLAVRKSPSFGGNILRRAPVLLVVSKPNRARCTNGRYLGDVAGVRSLSSYAANTLPRALIRLYVDNFSFLQGNILTIFVVLIKAFYQMKCVSTMLIIR